MKVLIHGCSLTFGDELVADEKWRNVHSSLEHADPDNRKHRLKNRWAGIFCDHFGLDERVDKSRGGCTNPTIFRETINEVIQHHYDFVLLGWSFNERLEFFNRKTYGWLHLQRWSYEHYTWKDNTLRHLMFGEYDRTPELLELEGARHRFALASILDNLGMPYLFIPAGDNFTCNVPAYHDEAGQLRSFKQIMQNNHRVIMGDSFSEFSNKNGYPIGPASHPLEEANAAWAKKMIEHTEANQIL